MALHSHASENLSSHFTNAATEKAELSHREKLEGAKLTGSIDEKDRVTISKFAREAALNEEFIWTGRTPTEFIMQTVHKRAADAEKVLGKGSVTGPEKQRIVSDLVGEIRGFVGERISANIPTDAAESIVVSVDERDADLMRDIGVSSKIEDVAELFGGTRKDIIVAAANLTRKLEEDEKYFKEVAEKTGVDPKKVRVIANSVAETLFNYNDSITKYREAKKYPGNVSVEALCKWRLSQTLGLEAEKQVPRQDADAMKFITEQAFEGSGREAGVVILAASEKLAPLMAFGSLNEAVDATIKKVEAKRGGLVSEEEKEEAKKAVMEERAKAVAEARKVFDRSYWGVTVPDGYSKKDGKMGAVFEMKAYTYEEFNEWIKLLEQDESTYENGLLIKNGLQTTTIAIDKKQNRLRARILGPAVFEERNFAQLKNGSEVRVPVIVRFPNSVSREQLQKLYEIAQQFGMTNLVFQRLPVTTKNIHEVGQKMVKGALAKADSKTLSNLEMEILLELSRGKVWGFEEK